MIFSMNIPKKLKPVIFTAIKLAVTIALFYVITKKIDIARALDFPIQNKFFLGLALVIALALVFLQGLRWHFLLQSMKLSTDLGKDIKSVWAGHFLNNVLPTSAAGDLVRSYSLRFRGASRGQWVSALLLEKFCAFSTALALGAAMTISSHLGNLPFAIRAIVLLAFAAVFLGTFLLRLITRLGWNVLSKRIIGFFNLLLSFITSVPKERSGRLTLLTSLAINIIICLIFYCIVSATGAKLNIFQCFFIVPVFTVLAGIPVSYGGWGVRELSGIHLLGFYGLSPELSLSVTLLFGLTIFISSLPGVLVIKSFSTLLNRREAAAT